MRKVGLLVTVNVIFIKQKHPFSPADTPKTEMALILICILIDLLPSVEAQSPAVLHWEQPRLAHAPIPDVAAALQPLAYAA